MSDPRPIEFNTDLASLAAELDAPRREPLFTLPANRFHQRKAAKERSSKRRRGIKKLIRPENAQAIVPLLPRDADERLHCILRGDFVLCDLIPAIIQARGRCPHLRIATLGMSAGNADTLATLQSRGQIGTMTLVVSHYFREVDKTSTWREVTQILKDRCSFTVKRCHAKVICLPTESGDSFIVERSANLRSSDNLEQMLVLNDAETLAFHADWIDALKAR